VGKEKAIAIDETDLWDAGELKGVIDTSDQDYRKAEGFNQSTAIELLNKSPRHAFEKRRKQDAQAKDPKPDPDHSREREMGTVVHKLLLGSTVGYYEINLDDYRTKVAQIKRADCEREGITPILKPDLERCHLAASKAREQLRETFGIELDGRSEVPLYWAEQMPDKVMAERARAEGKAGYVSGASLKCKAKLDHITKDNRRILDLKTGEDANPKKIIRRILDSGCHVQAAAYSRALVANVPEVAGMVEFIDVFIETSGLVMCTPVAITGSLYELGERGWLRACKRWWESQNAGQYDGYTTHVIAPEAPPWALSDEMGADE
jgi:hypothetical protein